MKQFFFAVVTAASALICLDQTTDISDIWKIGIALAAGAIVWLIAKALFSKSAKTTAAPATPSAPAAPTPSATPTSKATLATAISGILVALLLIGGLIGVAIWLYRQLDDLIRADAAKPSTTVTVNPVGHDNIFIEDADFKNWINPGIEYTVFKLKKGWRWRWFIDKPIFFRVRATGEEPFALAEKSGSEYSANYDGVLEIKTDYSNNWVSITRRIYRQTRINEHP
ncbi:hypothetical protein HZB94_02470 [Candidatus Falkowbacteria bacterium]|nr:hypothetical protein [Candidatus Falkowbacteria bacterium]